MYKRFLCFIVLCFAIFSHVGCGKRIENNINKIKSNHTLYKTEPQHPKVNLTSEQVRKMTIDEKIGQMVLVGFNGYTINNHSREMVEKYHIGGFILFKRNIKDSKQLLSLLNSLKNINAANKWPLFITVDEEGGEITRMPPEFIKLPTSMKIGEINNNDFSYEIGEIIGKELKSFGFNMNLAPVLDINTNPKNPIIGDRSFGSNKEIVTRLGIQTMTGLQSQNIISVVKHFPGHGDTTIDSHLGLPSLENHLARLKAVELAPFSEAIKNKADAIMIAHILLPKIDSNPASLSKIIITDILRNELKFNGVVITDDIEMGAISNNYNIGEAAVEAINAGSDIVLVCHTYNKQIEVIKALKDAVLNNQISKQRINNSVYRILELKKKYNLSNNPIDSIDIDKLNSQIRKVLNTYLN